MTAVLASTLNGSGLLANATVPACLVEGEAGQGGPDLLAVDLEIDNGKLSRIAPAGTLAGAAAHEDLDGGMILPTLVDLHTHLDKGHIWPRKSNPDGSFLGALQAVGEDREANWSAEDVRARMDFALKCAHVHGTSAIRTHLDSIPPQETITWPVFNELRREWAGRIELQGVCLFGIDRLLSDENFADTIAETVAAAGGIMGAVTYMVPGLDQLLDKVFRAAMDRGLDLDFHVDETLDPAAMSLRLIAETALRVGFEGQIVCGHCCSLSTQEESDVDRTLDLLARARIAVVSLPMCNMYLQDRRPGRTPRRRGVTLLHEMRHRGIDVAIASDNTRDPFYAYGDLDLVEVHAQATRILQLDHPMADWVGCVSTVPARLMGVAHGHLEVGGTADLVLFRARNWNELLSRPGGPRDVIRAGYSLDTTLPDYRELDPILQKRTA